MELGRNGQHHRRHCYYVQGLQRCPGVRCRLLQLFMQEILNWLEILIYWSIFYQIWLKRMKQIFHRAHLRFQQLPWPSWLRRSLSKREIMSSNLIGSTSFCQNDMACCTVPLLPLSRWCFIEFVFVHKLCHACQLNYK